MRENRTMHATEQGYWASVPTPLAELGVRLVPTSPTYLEDVVRLSWALLLLATHVELAHRRAVGSPLDQETVVAAFEHASPGKIAALLTKTAPPERSWAWDQPNEMLVPLGRLVGSKRFDARHAVQWIAQIRNAWAHHGRLPASRGECAQALEMAVRGLISSHARLASARLVYTERVERFGDHEGYRGVALEGAMPTPFRRGAWQPGAPGISQGHVFLLDESGAMLDLHPFVHFDGQRCVQLAELKRHRGELRGTWWWALESQSQPDTGPSAARDLAFALPVAPAMIEPAQIYVDAVASQPGIAASRVSSSSVEAPPALRSSAPLLLLGGGLLAGSVGLCVVGAAAVAIWSTPAPDAAGPPTLPQVGSSASAPTCIAHAPSTHPDDVPSWITGLDLRWAESAQSVDRRCGARLVDASLTGCSILTGRDLMPLGATGLPRVWVARGAFDTRSGLFEITVESHEAPSTIASIVSARYGTPSSVDGQRHVWNIDNVRISLAGSRREAGASVLVVRYRPLSDPFHRDRASICGSR